MDPWGIAVVAGLVIGYAAVSRRLERSVISSAMVFVAGGLIVGPELLGWFDPGISNEGVRVLAEATLTLVLFSDAARIDVVALRREIEMPARLLGIGLPLTIVAGTIAAVVVFPELLWAEALVLAIVLAPTDAALGQAVVSDKRLPSRVRQSLNVESGLNDGICVPLLLIALAIAEAEENAFGGGHAVRIVLEEIGYGVLGGVTAGFVAAALLRYVEPRRLVAEDWLQVIPLAAAALAYGIAAPLGGSGFIAAFVGGLVFGALELRGRSDITYLTDTTGLVLAAVTFVVFGASALSDTLHVVGWQIVLYAVLSLTVIRMVPVWLALRGTRARGADHRLRRLVRAPWPCVDRLRRARARGLRARTCGPHDCDRRHRHSHVGVRPRCNRRASDDRLRALVRSSAAAAGDGEPSGDGDPVAVGTSERCRRGGVRWLRQCSTSTSPRLPVGDRRPCDATSRRTLLRREQFLELAERSANVIGTLGLGRASFRRQERVGEEAGERREERDADREHEESDEAATRRHRVVVAVPHCRRCDVAPPERVTARDVRAGGVLLEVELEQPTTSRTTKPTKMTR